MPPRLALTNAKVPQLGIRNRMTAYTTTTTFTETKESSRAGEWVLKGPVTGPRPRHVRGVAVAEARASGVDTRCLTNVVTLKPCSHTGSTGPYLQATPGAVIARVVNSVDRSGAQSGEGAAVLPNTCVDVVPGFEEEAGRALMQRLHDSVTVGYPWAAIVWAISWDGRAAVADQMVPANGLSGREPERRVISSGQGAMVS